MVTKIHQIETITDEFKQAKNFAAYRRYKKWQQWKMGEIIGKNQATVSKYEDGSYDIPPEIVKLLHDNFGYSYDFHYNSTGPMELKEKKEPTSQAVASDILIMAMQKQINELKLRVTALENFIKTKQEYSDQNK